ncbi:MAG: NfeD family protein [Candidatus Verstraetearchaeota archaeon]|nr:NfeD family protein [Candidatus Verstraetearchaeota archaeon]
MPSKLEVTLALSDEILIIALAAAAIIFLLSTLGVLDLVSEFIIGAFFVAFFGIVLIKVWQAQVRKPAVGAEALVGRRGIVSSDLEPEGTVFVDGAYWTARAPYPIPKGEEVEIVGHEGLVLDVRQKGDKGSGQ